MQSVSSDFLAAEIAPVNSPVAQFKASWTKTYGGGSGIFTIETSLIQGSDTIPGDGYVPNDFALFSFEDDTAYVESIQVDRFFDQPTSVSRAALDVKLKNDSDYFSATGTSAIAGLVTIGKPLQVKIGFGAELLNIFNGVVSDYPTFNKLAKTVEVFGFDLVDIISNQYLTTAISGTNLTVDAILVNIFAQLGISSSNYVFGAGVSVIPSVTIPAGTLIGTIIKNLMIAEGGFFWADETGKFRFLPRNVNPYTVPNFTLSDDYVMDYQDLITNYIINSCQVTGTNGIMATYSDLNSVATYGYQLLQITSDYVQSAEAAYSLAYLYVTSNSSQEAFHVLKLRGLPQFQLGDVVNWNNLSYVIIRAKTIYDASNGFISEFTIKRYTLGAYFTIGTSLIGGTSQIAP